MEPKNSGQDPWHRMRWLWSVTHIPALMACCIANLVLEKQWCTYASHIIHLHIHCSMGSVRGCSTYLVYERLQPKIYIIHCHALLPSCGNEELIAGSMILVHPGQTAPDGSNWTKQYHFSISIHKVLERRDGELLKSWDCALCLSHNTCCNLSLVDILYFYG